MSENNDPNVAPVRNDGGVSPVPAPSEPHVQPQVQPQPQAQPQHQAQQPGSAPVPPVGTPRGEQVYAQPVYQQAAETMQATPVPAGQPTYTQVQAQAQAAAEQAYRQQVYQAYAEQGQGKHVQPGAPMPGGPVKPGKDKKAPGFGKTFAAGFAGAALAVVIGLGGFAAFEAMSDDQASPASPAAPASITVDGEDTTLAEAVAAKALPSIASIDTFQKTGVSRLSGHGFEGIGNDDDSSLTPLGSGSGVVIRDDGYVITNFHVIEGADEVHATIQGQEYPAQIVGSDPSSDIAVLKVDASGLTAIEIGSSSDLTVGEWVMTLGNPFGLQNSVSTGIVSAMQRSSTMTTEGGEPVVYPNMIQTDAAINPGNSGGALVDADGKLIGINTLIQSYSGSSSAVGFAIPIDYAMGLVDQIIDGETPTHAQLGVSMATITPEMAKYYHLPVNAGVLVANVYADTAADEAGVKKGDIITSFDGEAVTDASELMLDVREHNVGDAVDMVVNRDGKEQTIQVTLGSDEASASAGNAYGYGERRGLGDNGGGWGF